MDKATLAELERIRLQGLDDMYPVLDDMPAYIPTLEELREVMTWDDVIGWRGVISAHEDALIHGGLGFYCICYCSGADRAYYEQRTCLRLAGLYAERKGKMKRSGWYAEKA